MKASISKFSHWHRQCLRMRLNAYKLINSLSWLDVAYRIICSDTNSLEFPELTEEEENLLDELNRFDSKKSSRLRQDKGWPIQSQDLIRFVDGDKKNKGPKKPRQTSDQKLIPIYDFLLSLSYLPEYFLDLNKENELYNTIYSFVEYIGIVQLEGAHENNFDISGIYKTTETKGELSNNREIEFLISPENKYYSVTEKSITYRSNIQKPISIDIYSGWGANINLELNSLIFFLKNHTEIDSKDSWKNQRVYSLTGLKSKNDEIKEIAINQLTGIHITDTESDIKNSLINNHMILKRNYGETCLNAEKHDNVISIHGHKKDKSKTMSFGSENSAAEKWKRHKNIDKAGKGNGMESENTSKKFLESAQKGYFWEIDEYVNSSGDVNYENPKTKVRAIHLVASRSAIPALESLEKSSDLEYLAVDAKGNLPSYYAWVAADNSDLGEYLQKKEMAEAVKKNINYEEFIQNKPLDRN